jgi:hypothetical protein
MLFKQIRITLSSNQNPDRSPSSGVREIPYLEFPELSKFQDLKHAVFTRHGGVSNAPFQSLNCGTGTRDNPEHVRTNLEIVAQSMANSDLVFLEQIHSAETVLVREKDRHFGVPLAKADAMLTDLAQTGLLIKQADCQAVILYDPVKRTIANVHCGWRGNQKNILATAVRQMQAMFGSPAEEIRAAIGPSLGPCCAEFRTYTEIFPPEFRNFMIRPDYFDLWAVSRWQLMEAGLKEKHIEIAGICTRCRTDLFFSYRGEGETSGRFATVVMLK